ncbi:putative HIT-like protein [Diplonema papillatum]|nr:putative HIT-like protein [Diplonema papillatum]
MQPRACVTAGVLSVLLLLFSEPADTVQQTPGKERRGNDMGEVEKARAAGPSGGDSIFTKIYSGAIPASFVHKDDKCFAIKDANPQAPVHLLVIPIKPIPALSAAAPEDLELLGHLMLTAKKVAAEAGLADNGYRIVINDGRDGAQSVHHIHVHVLGGRQMKWPPG